jgi:DNA-binding transcriptional MerR regulator
MANVFMFRGVDYELGYNDYKLSEDTLGISDKINAQNKKITNNDFSYRIINHWEANGLIANTRKDNKGWRRYSLVDVVWLHIIKELRAFGLSLEQIVKVKKNLSTPNVTSKSEFPLLEYYIALAMVNEPVYLLVFSNGSAHPLTENEYQMNREFNTSTSHMQIQLNPIIQKMFPGMNLKPEFKESHKISIEERKGVLMLRLGCFEEVKIANEDSDKDIEIKNVKGAEMAVEDAIQLIYKHNFDSVTIKHGIEKYYYFRYKAAKNQKNTTFDE